jgi:hypothetical protein
MFASVLAKVPVEDNIGLDEDIGRCGEDEKTVLVSRAAVDRPRDAKRSADCIDETLPWAESENGA